MIDDALNTQKTINVMKGKMVVELKEQKIKKLRIFCIPKEEQIRVKTTLI